MNSNSNIDISSAESLDLFDQEFYFQWHITERCNRRCDHCYQASYSASGELSDSELLEVAGRLEAALEVWERDGAVSITGGEPWLRKDAVLSLLDYFEKKRKVVRIDLLTNGELIDEEACRMLRRRPLLRRVQVSIEAADPVLHDAIRGPKSFEATRDAVSRMKPNGLQVAAMMTISKLNVGQVQGVLELLRDWDVDYFSLDRFIPEGQAADHKEWVLSSDEVREAYEALYRWSRQHRRPHVLMYRPLFCLIDSEAPDVGAMCSVGANALTIMPDGTIYPCRRLPIPLGNVMKDSLYEIWYSSPILWRVRVPENLHGRCASCELAPVCRGCRAIALALTGDWLEEDPHCWKEENAIPASGKK